MFYMHGSMMRDNIDFNFHRFILVVHFLRSRLKAVAMRKVFLVFFAVETLLLRS